ncbi:hypothetical protein [Photorhabdus temperata]|uniref:hypothetical protein n=1 Tax=Photorhabdus temperata TaxID=574560 RepID=UPI000FFCA20B|nr:hypothetical protein [Photorhabdus temperata]
MRLFWNQYPVNLLQLDSQKTIKHRFKLNTAYCLPLAHPLPLASPMNTSNARVTRLLIVVPSANARDRTEATRPGGNL